MSVGAVNKQTGDRIQTAGMPAVDSVLSGVSTNPVQNRVVKAAFDGKQDTLTFDDTPTDGSNNPVKSNGIYDALATKANTDMVAADFNAVTSYTAGNYCVQDGKLYKFKNNHSGAWSSADVDEVKITGELSSLKSGLIGAYYKLDNSVKGETITTLWGTVTKISNVVTIQGLWVGSAANTDVITLLPEGYRPAGPAAAMGSGILYNAGTLICAEYSILPTGELRQAQQVGAASGGTFTFTYAV